jgi:hypothetical protein
MRPDDHIHEAELMLSKASMASSDEAFRTFATRAQVHAQIAQAQLTARSVELAEEAMAVTRILARPPVNVPFPSGDTA